MRVQFACGTVLKAMNETKGIISLCLILLILISCGPGGKPVSPGEELRAYCIRE